MATDKDRRRKYDDKVTIICPVCGEEAVKSARFVRHGRKQGKTGPYCDRSCAGVGGMTVARERGHAGIRSDQTSSKGMT